MYWSCQQFVFNFANEVENEFIELQILSYIIYILKLWAIKRHATLITDTTNDNLF